MRPAIIEKCFYACTLGRELEEFLANSFGDWGEPQDRQDGAEAIWRMMESGLLVLEWAPKFFDAQGRKRGFQASDLIEPYQEDDPDASVVWLATEFLLTPAGHVLGERFPYVENPETEEACIPPAFGEVLSEIFARHGVGWDVPCPFQVPAGWEPEYVKYNREQGR